MAETNVNELLLLVNQQVEFQENMGEQLLKAEAMAQVALGDDFLDSPDIITHHYLWALYDIIERVCVSTSIDKDILT